MNLYQHFNQMFIHGIDSDYLEIKQYEKENLEEVLNSFINKFENIEQKNRFHLVLNNIERNYLDLAQFNINKSRTRIIRDGIKKAIEEDDEYQKYLTRK